jgi:hypothetical protein
MYGRERRAVNLQQMTVEQDPKGGDTATATEPKLPENTLEALYKRPAKSFKLIKLPPLYEHELTKPAQFKLWAAFNTVHSMYFNMNLSRALWRDLEKKDHRGRVRESDADILRAAITFAGAGLDASLKQLIRDTIRPLIEINTSCLTKYHEFVDRHLASGEAVHRKHLRTVLVDERGSSAALVELYEWDLTGDSLQSAQQVQEVCGALGVNDKSIRRRLQEGECLDKMFRARNAIVHQLDLVPGASDERTRRSIEQAREFSREALDVTQLIINEVGRALGKRKGAPKPS